MVLAQLVSSFLVLGTGALVTFLTKDAFFLVAAIFLALLASIMFAAIPSPSSVNFTSADPTDVTWIGQSNGLNATGVFSMSVNLTNSLVIWISPTGDTTQEAYVLFVQNMNSNLPGNVPSNKTSLTRWDGKQYNLIATAGDNNEPNQNFTFDQCQLTVTQSLPVVQLLLMPGSVRLFAINGENTLKCNSSSDLTNPALNALVLNYVWPGKGTTNLLPCVGNVGVATSNAQESTCPAQVIGPLTLPAPSSASSFVLAQDWNTDCFSNSTTGADGTVQTGYAFGASVFDPTWSFDGTKGTTISFDLLYSGQESDTTQNGVALVLGQTSRLFQAAGETQMVVCFPLPATRVLELQEDEFNVSIHSYPMFLYKLAATSSPGMGIVTWSGDGWQLNCIGQTDCNGSDCDKETCQADEPPMLGVKIPEDQSCAIAAAMLGYKTCGSPDMTTNCTLMGVKPSAPCGTLFPGEMSDYNALAEAIANGAPNAPGPAPASQVTCAGTSGSVQYACVVSNESIDMQWVDGQGNNVSLLKYSPPVAMDLKVFGFVVYTSSLAACTGNWSKTQVQVANVSFS